jgi:hypothetical protein
LRLGGVVGYNVGWGGVPTHESLYVSMRIASPVRQGGGLGLTPALLYRL